MTWFARSLFVCAAVLSARPVSAEAGDPTFHPVANLSNSANRPSDAVDMATDGANVYTVWREQVAPGAEELRFRASNNHGASFGDGPGGRTILSVALPHRLFNVRIAAAGGIVLVLFSTGDDEANVQFWVLRSADGGASFPPTPFDVSGVDAGHHGDIAINGAGEAHIVMENAALGEIHHRRSTDAGATFSPAVNISGTSDVSGNPRVSSNGGNVAVVWEETGPDGMSPADVAFAYSGDSGASFGPALNLSASAAPSDAPDVAFLDAIHVAWVEDGAVHYRRSADGSTFTGAVVLGAPPAGEVARTPAVSGVGPLLNVAWTTHNPSAANDGPFLRRSEDGGVNFSSTLDVGPAGGPFDAIAIGGASPLKIAWPHSSSGSPSESDVLFLREIACSSSWLAAVSDVWTNAARWSSGAVPGAADDVCLTVPGSYTVTVRTDQFANSVVIGAAGVAGPVLRIEGQRPGSSAPIPGTLTVANGVTNFGRITLISTGTITSGEARLTVSSGTLTNASGGIIETVQGSQGGRTINATAVNDGTISFGWDVTLNGNWTNNNSVTLAAGRTLTLGGAAAFSQNDGSLSLTGTLVSTGGTFNYNGGEITGTPLVLTSATLNVGPASTGAGTFKMRRDSTLSGNIASAQTVQIEAERPGSSGPINATLTATGDFINAGTIQLTSIGTIGSGTATLVVPAGSVLTNASSGRIEALQGSQGGRVLNGRFSNNGTVQVSWPTTIDGTNALFTNNNSFIIDGDRTLSMSGSDDRFVQGAGMLDVGGTFHMVGGTFDFNGGTVDTTIGAAGAVILESSTLNFGPASTGAGHFRLRRVSTLTGNIAAGQTVTIEAERPGSSAPINATVTVIGSWTNAGTIQLTSIGTIASGTASLTVADGAVLTNASTGRIETIQGSQGGRGINGNVVSNGTTVIGWSTVLGGTAATHTNNGVYQVQASRTLSISGDEVFVQGGGTLDVDGTFHMTGATFNFNGGSVDAGAGLAILETSALNFGAGSTGAAHFRVRRNSTLSGDIAAGQTVTIEAERPGSSSSINATLTASADFTNGGTIQLTSIGTIVSGTATLAMAGSSVMTISSTGRVETLQGSQGGRVISGSFINNGNVLIGWSVSLAGADATYTNNGSFVVQDARTVSIAVSSSTFVQAAGTLDIEGTVNMNGATFNFNGGTVDAVGGLGNLQDAVLNFGGSTGTAHFRLRRNSTLTGNIAAGQTVTIEAERPGSSAPINATVTIIGNVTNAGTIQLTSIGTIVSGTATLTIADGAVLTNASTGRIETLQGSQGGRGINGNVVNNGTTVIGWPTVLGGTAATHTNNGVFQIQASRTLSMSGDETFVQGGGTLEVDGTFHMNGATFNFNGGSVDASTGLAILETSALNIGPGSTGAAHFRVRRNSTLTGNIAAGQTVTIEAERPGSSAPIHATMTVLGNAINAGTIQLTSIGTISSGAAALTVADGAVLTNATTGRIETIQGSQGGRGINGNIVSNGTIIIGWSAVLGGTAATHTNNGLYQVQASRTLSISGDETFVQGGGTLEVDGTFHINGATFNFNGGSVDASTGLAILEASALNVGPGSTGAAHFRVRRNSTLTGNIAAGQTVTIEAERPGSSAPIHATMTVLGNATNAGTIQLTSIGTISSGASTLAVGAGAVLTNAATGRIETLQGSQGGRFVTGPVRNEGIVALGTAMTYSAGTFRNVSPGSITGGGNLTLATTSVFFGTGSVTANVFNNGQFNAGQSPGALSITGNFTQTASGSFNVEVGGFTAGTEYDATAISGTATLAGTLNVSLFGGFCEAGGPFDVLTYSGGSGDFAAKNGLNQGGLVFTAARNSTFYRLNATGECVSAPIANNDAYSVTEDGVLNVAAPGVLANDTDPQGTALTASLFTSASHGDVVVNADGSFIYTPAPDFFGSDSFAYVANDNFENSAPATVTITVNAANDPPNAVDDAAIVDEDSGQNSVAVLANDETVPDAGETLTITAVTQGASGAVVITGGGSGLTYAPNPNFSGTDTFTYTVSDGVVTDVATVNVQVNAINDPPEAIDDAAAVDEDSSANPIDVLSNDTTSGEVGETLSIEAVTQGANGVVAIEGGGASVTYTPGPNFHGSDSFTYTVADGNGGTDTALVHVTVASVNDPPDAQDDAVSADEDSGANQLDLLINDSAAPDQGETLQVTAATSGANGSVEISADGMSVLYTPAAEFSGSDSFTYTISDGNGGTDTATVTVVVNGVNDPPDAADDTAGVQEDSAANVIDVLANDSFAPDAGETLVITEVTQGANGTVAIDEGWITYTPHANFAGDDSFTYTIGDGNGGTDTATVIVTVNSVNDPPDAIDDSATVDEDSGATSVDVLANDSLAPDAGETLAITAVTQGANGSVVITGGMVSYTPHANFSGADQFTYTVGDGNGGTDTATVHVTVTPVNDVPVLSPIAAQTSNPGDTVNIDVTATDIDGDSLTFSASGLPAGASIDSASGDITGALAAGSAGTHTVMVTVDDGHGGVASGSFEWTITATTTDADGDGVADDVDQCPGTPPGTVVNASGCAISQICSATATWQNHGQYLSCVSNNSAEFERTGLISGAQRGAIVSAAAKSDVGKKK